MPCLNGSDFWHRMQRKLTRSAAAGDMESEKCHLSGIIIRDLSSVVSNYRSTQTLDQYLKDQNVLGATPAAFLACDFDLHTQVSHARLVLTELQVSNVLKLPDCKIRTLARTPAPAQWLHRAALWLHQTCTFQRAAW